MTVEHPLLSIQPIVPADRKWVLAHLLRLSSSDRYLRFCTVASDAYIQRYVETVMDIDSNLAFGAIDLSACEDGLVGLANIAIVDETSCELAFSIDEQFRGTGLARTLMGKAIGRCEELGMKKLCMSCLRENRKMQALAKSFGLNMSITYDEAYAELGITK